MSKEDKETLKKWRLQKLEACKEFPKYFYYLSPIENIENIVKYGILSKNETVKNNLNAISFADRDVQGWRKAKNCLISNSKNKKLHDLVPLYLNSKTPTLYSRKPIQNRLFFCLIDAKKLISDINIEFAFTDGNATNLNTKFYYSLNNLKNLNWNIINSSSWSDKPDGKRIRNSEFLIFPKVNLSHIKIISCFNDEILKKINNIFQKNKLEIEINVNKNLYFDTL